MPGPHRLWRDRPASPLRRARVAKGLTLAQLAAAVECAVSTVHVLESRGRGSATLWARVAAVLGVPIGEIRFGGGKSADARQLDLDAMASRAGAGTLLRELDALERRAP